MKETEYRPEDLPETREAAAKSAGEVRAEPPGEAKGGPGPRGRLPARRPRRRKRRGARWSSATSKTRPGR